MKIKTNLSSGILFLVLGLAALYVIPSQIPAGNNAYGPRLFPYIVTAIMILSSLGLLAGEWSEYRKGKKENREERMAKDITVLHAYELKRTGLMFLIMTAYIFLIEPIGFIPASILFVSGILAFFKSKKILYYVVCIGIVVAVYFGFRLFLKVYLP